MKTLLPRDREDKLRWWLAAAFAGLSFLIGITYIGHMCNAGCRPVELFGVALVQFFIILCIPRYRYSLPIAVALLLLQCILRNPYWEWIHG